MTNIIPIKAVIEAATPSDRDWPDPVPLPRRLLAVPSFDVGMLPTRLGPWVEDISERLGIAPDFAGIAAMVSAGAMIGSKMAIRPQAHTPWAEPFNLFGCVIGSPSALKTPAISEVLQPLRRIEKRLNDEYHNALAKHEMDMNAHAVEQDVAQRQAKKLFTEGKRDEANTLLASVAPPNPPIHRRLLVGNTTVERLGEICRDNPDGVLVECDELVTLLNDLAAPEKELARGFFMFGWSGDKPYTFDRIMRGMTRIERTTLSLIGTSQPDIWAGYLRHALGKRNDGFAARIQLLSWPDMPPQWRNVDRPPHAAARDDAFECFDQLHSLIPEGVGAMRDVFDDGTGIPFLRYTPEALERYVAWREELERQVRDPGITPALEQHFGKYRGLSARLAGICHVASGEYGPVGLPAVEQSMSWLSYLEQHARRAYGAITLDSNEAARSILRKIEAGQLVDGFTERSIYDNGWAGLSKGQRLTDGLNALIEYHWISADIVVTGGRPKTVYRVNPKAYQRAKAA